MIITFRHSGKYTGGRFYIEEIIDSLIAQRELLKAGAASLAEIEGEIEIDDLKIIVEKIETDSLFWDLLVELNAKYQDSITPVVVEGVERMFGVDVPEDMEPLLSLLALAVTYMVARYAYERVLRSKGGGAPSVHITGEGNVVIQNIAQIVHQSPEVVEAALERAIPPGRRRNLISKVADFLRPSRRQSGERIEIVGAPPISPEALREFPSDAALASGHL